MSTKIIKNHLVVWPLFHAILLKGTWQPEFTQVLLERLATMKCESVKHDGGKAIMLLCNKPVRGYCTLPQISMFCTLSRNCQHLFEKQQMHLTLNCQRNWNIASKLSQTKWIFSYPNIIFTVLRNNLNIPWPTKISTIFEFLEQFTIIVWLPSTRE